MAFELPPLPYAYDALEPHIDNYHTNREVASVREILWTFEVARELRAAGFRSLLRL